MLHIEIRAAASTPIVFSPSDTSEVNVDLFAPEEIPLQTLGNRLHQKGNDLDTLRQEVELKEMEQFKIVRLRSIVNEREQQA